MISEDMINFSFNILDTNQIREEIINLVELIEKERPKNILEIGTQKGGTLYFWINIESASQIISIDLEKDNLKPVKEGVEDKELILINGNSHKEEVFEKVQRKLNYKLDFLFIDGDHSYEGVKQDFETYSSLVTKNGLIAFHDIVPASKKRVGGVPDFWGEIKEDYKSKEFVKSWNQPGFGIGVIFK